jgi:hypothetical protein
LFGHVSIFIPPLFFYLSRIGNSFPKRVLIRKKPVAQLYSWAASYCTLGIPKAEPGA